MSLIYNNTEIPYSGGDISYNGTLLDKIIYNGITVWERITDIEKECNGTNFTGAQIWRCNTWAHGFSMTKSIAHSFRAYFNDNPGYAQAATGLFSKKGYNYCKVLWANNHWGTNYPVLSFYLRLLYGDVVTKSHDDPSNFELFIYDNNLNATRYGKGEAFPISRTNTIILQEKNYVDGVNSFSTHWGVWGQIINLNDTTTYPNIKSVDDIEISAYSDFKKNSTDPAAFGLGILSIELSTNKLSLTTDEINGYSVEGTNII